ncbi:hypothetical protein [Microbulbifer sp. JMSA003]|uniref:Cap15 family cyclic dinucleotide receptor domain-containing protein n=1 Tax=Microbulbifer sp. JMSA003 TaxID=3243369 RepID=UPI0040398555
MWKVLPQFGLLKLLIFLLSAIATSALAWATGGWLSFVSFFSAEGFGKLIGVLTPIFIIFLAVVWLFGSIFWKWVWAIPGLGDMLNKNVCPDINGEWIGFTESTYKDESGNPVKTEVELTVKASFFSLDMKLKSTNEYQRSTVIQSEIYKDPRNGSFYVSYIFESVVDRPEAKDDSKFDGAAKLNVRFKDSEIELVGVYWTNRTWQRSGQTAGTIHLTRK